MRKHISVCLVICTKAIFKRALFIALSGVMMEHKYVLALIQTYTHTHFIHIAQTCCNNGVKGKRSEEWVAKINDLMLITWSFSNFNWKSSYKGFEKKSSLKCRKSSNFNFLLKPSLIVHMPSIYFPHAFTYIKKRRRIIILVLLQPQSFIITVPCHDFIWFLKLF